MISRRQLPVIVLVASAFAPLSAHGHPGHGSVNFATGLAHPLSGLDHLLVALAIGLWAAQLGGRARWSVPVAFVSMVAVGGALALAGFTPPLLEQGILASALALGFFLLLALKLRLPASIGAAAVFAFFHGAAHGSEISQEASRFSYGAGLLLATLALHACGLAAGSLLRRSFQGVGLRLAGAGVLALTALFLVF